MVWLDLMGFYLLSVIHTSLMILAAHAISPVPEEMRYAFRRIPLIPIFNLITASIITFFLIKALVSK